MGGLFAIPLTWRQVARGRNVRAVPAISETCPSGQDISWSLASWTRTDGHDTFAVWR